MADISDIEQQISHMEIPVDIFGIFRGEKLLNIFSRINEKIVQLNKRRGFFLEERNGGA
jgi:hypothetical protein